VQSGGTPQPQESLPEWRATLIRLASWRAVLGTILSDEDLAANARAEFERVGSRFYGYHSWSSIVTHDGTQCFRVVVAAPDGHSVLKDAPTDAEALGLALAEHMARKRA